MQTLRLTTLIDAPVQRCFFLSLCVDLQIRAADTLGEVAIGGLTSGVLSVGDSVIWATPRVHPQLQRTCRTEVVRPYTLIREVMTGGHLVALEHDRHFAPMNDGTRVRDELRFESPPGLLGTLLRQRLRTHLNNLLKERSTLLKRVAQTEEWRRYLEDPVTPEPASPTA